MRLGLHGREGHGHQAPGDHDHRQPARRCLLHVQLVCRISISCSAAELPTAALASCPKQMHTAARPLWLHGGPLHALNARGLAGHECKSYYNTTAIYTPGLLSLKAGIKDAPCGSAHSYKNHVAWHLQANEESQGARLRGGIQHSMQSIEFLEMSKWLHRSGLTSAAR